MDWLTKQVNMIIILTAYGSALLWMNGRFNDIDRRFHIVDAEILTVRNDMNQRFSEVDKEIAITKAIMIMKKIMPVELAQGKVEE